VPAALDPRSYRRALAFAAALTSIAVAAGAGAPAPAPAASPCARAQALLQAGYYADAERAFKRLLGVSACAPAGVKAARAKATPAAETKKKKRKHAEEDLKHAESKLAEAQRLEGAGFEEDARKLVKEVLEGSTGAKVSPGLRAPDQRIGWWRRLLGVLGPPLRLALEIAIAIAALAGAAVAALLLLTGTHRFCLRFHHTAHLSGFEGSSDATLGPVLSTALGSVIARMKDEAPGLQLYWQSGTEPKFEIPAAITQSLPQVGVLAGLVQVLDRLLYRRLHVVAGTVHPVHEHRGAGLTLAVSKRNGEAVDQVTIWERDFMLKEAGADAAEAVRYERLILPAAVWLAYRPSLGFKPTSPPLHARDWRSYALFALGELVADGVKERKLYERALDRDPNNIGARLNLAGLLLRRPDYEVPPPSAPGAVADGSRESWPERMKAAADHLGAVAACSSPDSEPIWYRARYMQAVVCVYRGEAPRALSLLAQMRSEMAVHGDRPTLRALVEAFAEPIAILKDTAHLIYAQAGQLPAEPAQLPAEPGQQAGGWLSATAEYNLACYWARRAGILALHEHERANAALQAVRCLRRAMDRDDDIRAEALVDPALDPIRKEPGFEALVQTPEPKDEPDKPQQYAITLDPGPVLRGLARR
jgi:hypothetical protein